MNVNTENTHTQQEYSSGVLLYVVRPQYRPLCNKDITELSIYLRTVVFVVIILYVGVFWVFFFTSMSPVPLCNG